MLGSWGSFFGGESWEMGILGIGIHLFFWIVLIGLFVYLFRQIGYRVLIRGIIKQNQALDDLLGRYARGEIDLKEYQKRKKELLLQ